MSEPTQTEFAADGQLTQARVPLEDALLAFSQRDTNGRLPIIVVPQRESRVQYGLLLAAVLLVGGAALLEIIVVPVGLLPLAIPVGLLLLVLAVFRSFIVIVPEGLNALLARGGRYVRTLGSGFHIVMPYIVVSHLVTRREIPFEVVAVELPTRDSVRANVDILLTFSITDPSRFVYRISADDFDQVLQASCQDALRRLLRGMSVDQVIGLQRGDTSELRAGISEDVETYGATIHKIVVTYAQPPIEFIRSQEARELAVMQRAEYMERQALALYQQANAAELKRQQTVADATAEALRLERLDERLQQHPLAARYDMQRMRLEVARALAGNTRAMLQVGSTDDIAEALLMRDLINAESGNSAQDTAEHHQS